jgi:CRP-like cAMP-binding protein
MKKSDWREKITAIFKTAVSLSDEDVNALLKHWRPLKLKRNEFLISKGEVEQHLYYVVRGSMRICYPHSTEEICVGFAYDTNLICSFPSFIRQKPSEYFIQALVGTELMAIRRKDFYNLFDLHPKLERAWRHLEEEALIGMIDREAELLTFTPEQRYGRLMKRSPHLFQIIPKKYIASYLRMSPETLSRIKLS